MHRHTYPFHAFLGWSQNPCSRSKALFLVLVTSKVLAPRPHLSQLFLSGALYCSILQTLHTKLPEGSESKDGCTSQGVCGKHTASHLVRVNLPDSTTLTQKLCLTYTAHPTIVSSRESSANAASQRLTGPKPVKQIFKYNTVQLPLKQHLAVNSLPWQICLRIFHYTAEYEAVLCVNHTYWLWAIGKHNKMMYSVGQQL